jgi:hypothetical protein
MREPGEIEKLQATIRTPRAAALAGIAFALIFGTMVVLLRRAVPSSADDVGAWLASSTKRNEVKVSLALLPFAGIAFLWFMGVIRNRLGEREDKFFATVFLGSGLLFVAMLFAAGAVMAAIAGVARKGHLDPQLWSFARHLVFVIMNTYALRMAAVFTIAATTLATRLGLVPKWLAATGYLAGLFLLVAATAVPGLELLFPIWVFLLSAHVLKTSWRREVAPS